MSDPILRSTGAPPSFAPVPLLALEARAPLPEPERRAAARRLLVGLAALLFVAGAGAFAIAVVLAFPRPPPPAPDRAPVTTTPAATTPAPAATAAAVVRQGLRVSVVGGASEDDQKMRRAALLQAAALAPGRLPLLVLVPDAVDQLVMDQAILFDEAWSRASRDTRRLDARVDVDALGAHLCREVARHNDPTVDVALSGAGADAVAAKLARALDDACVKATVVRVDGALDAPFRRSFFPDDDTFLRESRARHVKLLVEGAVEVAGDDASIHGILRVGNAESGRIDLVTAARTGRDANGVIDAWRDDIVKQIAPTWFPGNVMLTMRGVDNYTGAVAVLARLRGLPIAANVEVDGLDHGEAVYRIFAAVDGSDIASLVEGKDVGASAIEVLEVTPRTLVAQLRPR